ncbi:MAG: hypothetical protein O6650_03740, partial [Actinobacteria bacterium]|nr:hypothetical protein [Actinomycetota bacterium]
DGWLDIVHNEIDGIDRRDRNLAVVALISAALGSGHPRAAETLFGTDANVFTERARRELLDRLQVAYTQTAAHLCDLIRLVSGEGEADELQTRPTGVVTRSHFADA